MSNVRITLIAKYQAFFSSKIQCSNCFLLYIAYASVYITHNDNQNLNAILKFFCSTKLAEKYL